MVRSQQRTGYEDGVARMRRLLDQMSTEAVGLETVGCADEGDRLTSPALTAGIISPGRAGGAAHLPLVTTAVAAVPEVETAPAGEAPPALEATAAVSAPRVADAPPAATAPAAAAAMGTAAAVLDAPPAPLAAAVLDAAPAPLAPAVLEAAAAVLDVAPDAAAAPPAAAPPPAPTAPLAADAPWGARPPPEVEASVVPATPPEAATASETQAPSRADAAAHPPSSAADGRAPTGRRRRPSLRRLARGPLASGLAAAVLTAVVWRVIGGALQGWAVGLGMDDERGALVGALGAAAAAAAVVVAAGARVRAARIGTVLAVLAVQVVPFLVRGSHTATTEGLTAHVRVWGWILQPLGMTLLAVVGVSVGAAVGLLLRTDLAGLIQSLRRRRRGWVGLGVALVLVAVAAGPAMTAVQDGPISALYDYSSSPAGTSHDLPGGPAVAAGGAPSGAQGAAAPGAASADILPGRQRPGHIEAFSVGGRSSLVYLPGDYGAEPVRDFPVVYFLHGYPGNADDWVGDGAQLPQVLDQLISSGDLPPTIAVMPNGNGQTLSDAEWGDTEHGDRVETWLVTRVVPEVDRRYRTLGAHFRGIAGLSSGGFGALNLALRHGDVFRWAASYSGFFDARRDIFGAATGANSPAVAAPLLPPVSRMPVFIGVGDTDKGYVAQQMKFVSDLHALGWEPVRADDVPGGHGWEAWRLEMVHSLQWLGGLWGSDPGNPPPCRASCSD